MTPADEREWLNRFFPQISMILGGLLFRDLPPLKEDTHADFITDRQWVMVKVLRFEQYKKYPNEFSLESGRKDGKLSELHRAISGCGDYIFYGFADQEEKRLAAWFIGDLRQFRLWHTRYMHKHGKMPGNRIKKSGVVHTAYDLNMLPERFVVLKNG